MFIPSVHRRIHWLVYLSVGVVGTGLFVGMAERAYFGMEDGSVKVRNAPVNWSKKPRALSFPVLDTSSASVVCTHIHKQLFVLSQSSKSSWWWNCTPLEHSSSSPGGLCVGVMWSDTHAAPSWGFQCSFCCFLDVFVSVFRWKPFFVSLARSHTPISLPHAPFVSFWSKSVPL